VENTLGRRAIKHVGKKREGRRSRGRKKGGRHFIWLLHDGKKRSDEELGNHHTSPLSLPYSANQSCSQILLFPLLLGNVCDISNSGKSMGAGTVHLDSFLPLLVLPLLLLLIYCYDINDALLVAIQGIKP